MNDPKLPREIAETFEGRALSSLPLSLVIADPHREDCPIVYVNEAFTATTGYHANAVVGRNCRFLQGEDTDDSDRASIRAALDACKSVTVDIKNYRADQTPFMNRLMISPIHDADGGLLYFLGVQMERGVESDSERQVRALQMQVIEIQHRVKNHLSMILSMIRLEAAEREPKEMAQVLSRRVSALTLLYESIAGEASGAERIELGSYLSRVASVVHQLDGRADIRLNTEFAAHMTDANRASRLGLILSEVLTNALQHAFEPGVEGEVRVELTDGTPGRGMLTVLDDGRGMEEGTWPRSQSLGGRIVRHLISEVDGRLEVASTPGEGTRVTVDFAV